MFESEMSNSKMVVIAYISNKTCSESFMQICRVISIVTVIHITY